MSGKKLNFSQLRQMGKKYGKIIAEKAAEMNEELDRTLTAKGLDSAFKTPGDDQYITLAPNKAEAIAPSTPVPSADTVPSVRPIVTPPHTPTFTTGKMAKTPLKLPSFGTPSVLPTGTDTPKPPAEAEEPEEPVVIDPKPEPEPVPEPAPEPKPEKFLLPAYCRALTSKWMGDAVTAIVGDGVEEVPEEVVNGSPETGVPEASEDGDNTPEKTEEPEPTPEVTPEPAAEPAPAPAQLQRLQELEEQVTIAGKVTRAMQDTIDDLQAQQRSMMSTRQVDVLKREMALTLEAEQRRTARFRVANDDLSKELHAMKGAAKVTEDAGDTLKGDVTRARAAAEEATAKAKAAEADAQLHADRAASLRADIDEQKAVIRQRDATIADLQQALGRRAQQYTKASADAADAARRKTDRLTSRITDLEAELAIVRDELHASRIAMKEVEEEVESHRVGRAAAEREARCTTDALAAATRPMVTEIAALKARLGAETRGRQTAEADLARARADQEAATGHGVAKEEVYRRELGAAHESLSSETERAATLERERDSVQGALVEAERAARERQTTLETELAEARARADTLASRVDALEAVKPETGRDLPAMFNAALELIAEHEATIERLRARR